MRPLSLLTTKALRIYQYRWEFLRLAGFESHPLRQYLKPSVERKLARCRNRSRKPSSPRGNLQRLDVAFDLCRDFVGGDLQVIARLQIHPECRTVLKVTGKAECRVCRDAAAFVDNVSDPSHRDAQIHCHSVHAQSERSHELLAENFSWMYWFESMGHA